MADVQELRRQHSVFAEDVFSFLLHKTGIESQYIKKSDFFQPAVGDAILTISYIFKKDYRAIFNRLQESLKRIRMFEKYCKIIPVKQDERYFYNFMTRVSLIFEMAMYCHSEGLNYFREGCKCMEEYEDLQFFHSAGGWSKLQRSAEFISSLGRPLLLLVNLDYKLVEEIVTFADAVEALNKLFLVEGNLKMLDGAELSFLKNLNKKLIARGQAVENKYAGKANTTEETESIVNLNTSSTATIADTKSDPNLEVEKVIKDYFQQCFSAFASSNEIPELEDLTGDHNDEYTAVLAADSKESAGNSCDKLNKTSGIETNEDSAFGTSVCDSILHSPTRTSNLAQNTPYLANQQDLSFTKCTVPVPIEDHPARECSEEVFSETSPIKSEDLFRNALKCMRDKISAAQKVSFIVPQKYLDSRTSGDSSECKRLYNSKMCTPSARKKLDEHLKKVLDKNIESENYNTMPSGDLLVCPPDSLSQNENTLIIFTESSTDDEVDENTDVLICLFKEIEMNSQGHESGYPLRSRQPKRSEKEGLRDELDGAKSIKKNLKASGSGTPSKTPRKAKRRTTGIIRNVTYTEELTRLYKKHLTSILSEYFRHYEAKPNLDAQSRKSSETDKDNRLYVFAISESILEKRKALFDYSDEKKPVYGVQLYGNCSRPSVLPLPVQLALDSEIKEGNYFITSNGTCGVGPKVSVAEEDIWVIFFSGDGESDAINIGFDDASEIPKMFRSYEPVLKVFNSQPDIARKADIDLFEAILNTVVRNDLSGGVA